MTDLTPLNCDEVFRRLDDWLDRELSADETLLVQDHLVVCAMCAEEYGFQQSMLHNMKQKLRRIEVSPDLLSRISAQLERHATPGE
jgi:hypothetical protein